MPQGKEQDLREHLQNVAQLASDFAAKFGAADLGRWAGLWHDLGKFHPEFQRYLRTRGAQRGPEHKAAGAITAEMYQPLLAFLVAGHHGGLSSRAQLKTWLKEKRENVNVQQALDSAACNGAVLAPPVAVAEPKWLSTAKELETEFLLRMLFSALVDADFRDTEKHFSPEKSEVRVVAYNLNELWERFRANQQVLMSQPASAINELRNRVFEDCVAAAENTPGVFRLTVPTGLGKTRSAMAFALRHAILHALDRVIVAIPYTSIIEQTADVYRRIFGAESVLEHHSAVSVADPESPTLLEVWARLASENWDAPIVVTTTVQLFESLFGHQTSRCRKLHNIARSVLILDEVQTLPVSLLTPILDALRQLVAHYGVTVVLCTATQPALERNEFLEGFTRVKDIIPKPNSLFSVLKRVDYEYPRDGETMSWPDVAAVMRRHRQVLVVTNTKRDALALLHVLDDPQAFHLSTLLWGASARGTGRGARAAKPRFPLPFDLDTGDRSGSGSRLSDCAAGGWATGSHRASCWSL
jgi:CRISPR-associated endonuclease/helicase Cas3